jgi:Domain of unknown function (DUF1707)
VNESAEPPRRSIDIDIEYLLSHLHPRGHTMRRRPDSPYPMSGRWMGAPTATNLRVSDAERNAVADKLSRHFSEGRLDQAEFKERLDTAMSAKTQGDLNGLFDDLPPLASEPPPPPSRRSRLVPFLVMIVLLSVVAGSSLTWWPWFHVPWLLIAVVGFFLWHRAGRRRRHSHDAMR